MLRRTAFHDAHRPADYSYDDFFLLSSFLNGDLFMEVRVDRDAFFRGLQMVHNIVEPRQTLPVLANVLIETEQEAVRLTTTDLEVGARVSLPAQVLKSGTITISARKLVEIVKELPSAPLSLKLQENAWVALRCAGAAYKLVGLTADDFPAVGEGAAPVWTALDGKLLRDMLTQTTFAISHDESRYALNGVLFVLDDRELRLVATDGHRLALAIRPLAGKGGQVSGIVPRKAVQEIARIVGAGEDVEIAIGDNQFMLRMPNVLLIARLIEGTFPNYQQVVPRAHPFRMVASRGAMTAALRRVAVVSEERTRPVKFFFSPGALKLAAYSPDFGEAEEQVDVQYAGDEMVIGFNSRYVLDALGAQSGEQVVVEVKDGLSPGVVKSFDDDGTLCVIMPMRI
ncbi:MAG: DNA polymerase III subunit beta [Candidatus Rokuibacteriota bacterium]|nr:MAG: DNA polymerase III subunit beta [Candidatus Rokubacteria bacterium]